MTQQEYTNYKHPASVSAYMIGNRWEHTYWGYGFTDMLTRERTLPAIGTIKRVIQTAETVTPNRWQDGTEHPQVDCWALVELDSKRIVEIKACVKQTILDPQLYETIEQGKPRKRKGRGYNK